MAAITADPGVFVEWLAGVGVRGIDALEDLMASGLSIADHKGVLQPRLAEAVPSVENGLWVVLPDGRMETTWRIRANAEWHDGVPFTSDDLLFTAQVQQDPDLPLFTDPAFKRIESISAPDERTVTVRWKEPYVDADALFGAPPLPKHLLERAYTENKAGFTQLSYWSDDFVGTGPFRLREFVRGSHVVLEANDHFVLGRPKIDVVEVRFIPQATTIAANLLAGEIDVTLGKTLSLEQAIEVRNQWPDGKEIFASSNELRLTAQFIDPDPPIISNPQFRRAALRAIDRQQLVDSLLAGLGQVANTMMFPGQAAYRDIEARAPHYDYDPRLAAEMVQGLGYTKGTDGLFHDASGQPLVVEMRIEGADINNKAGLAIIDGWQQVGIGARAQSFAAGASNEYLYTYPAFWIRRGPSDIAGLRNLHSSRIPLPENNYRPGNVPRYSSPELDALLDRYVATIPRQERTEILGQILYHVADQLPELPLLFDVEPTVYSGRLTNVTGRWPASVRSSTQAWNAYEWDIAARS